MIFHIVTSRHATINFTMDGYNFSVLHPCCICTMMAIGPSNDSNRVVPLPLLYSCSSSCSCSFCSCSCSCSFCSCSCSCSCSCQSCFTLYINFLKNTASKANRSTSYSPADPSLCISHACGARMLAVFSAFQLPTPSRFFLSLLWFPRFLHRAPSISPTSSVLPTPQPCPSAILRQAKRHAAQRASASRALIPPPPAATSPLCSRAACLATPLAASLYLQSVCFLPWRALAAAQ